MRTRVGFGRTSGKQMHSCKRMWAWTIAHASKTREKKRFDIGCIGGYQILTVTRSTSELTVFVGSAKT
ncbi:MAG: hypothetical protein CMM01_15720 [Rhodopirellula sp.]|nr:hypothetical protein [Rhodopirellula sp.]